MNMALPFSFLMNVQISKSNIDYEFFSTDSCPLLRILCDAIKFE